MAKADVIAELQAKMDALAAPGGKARASTGAAAGPVPSSRPERRDDEAAEALRRVVGWLNAGDKPEVAVRERLARAGFSGQAIDSAVERAKELGFVDDVRYADVLVRSRMAQGRGVAGIERELSSIGVSPDRLSGWPHEYGIDDEAELGRALGFLERKPPRSRNVRDAAYRKLVGKGYSPSTASSAARIWAESHA